MLLTALCKCVTVLLLKRPRSSRFTCGAAVRRFQDSGFRSETAILIQKWSKVPIGTSAAAVLLGSSMAGLGADDRRSVQPLAPRGQLRFIHLLPSLGLVRAKIPRRIRRAPGKLSQKIKGFIPKTHFWGRAGCGDVTSLHKNLVKNRKTNFRQQAIQEPIFSVATR
jgi:hypothetical protein